MELFCDDYVHCVRVLHVIDREKLKMQVVNKRIICQPDSGAGIGSLSRSGRLSKWICCCPSNRWNVNLSKFFFFSFEKFKLWTFPCNKGGGNIKESFVSVFLWSWLAVNEDLKFCLVDCKEACVKEEGSGGRKWWRGLWIGRRFDGLIPGRRRRHLLQHLKRDDKATWLQLWTARRSLIGLCYTQSQPLNKNELLPRHHQHAALCKLCGAVFASLVKWNVHKAFSF